MSGFKRFMEIMWEVMKNDFSNWRSLGRKGKTVGVLMLLLNILMIFLFFGGFRMLSGSGA